MAKAKQLSHLAARPRASLRSEMFETLVLPGVELQFSLAFDDLPVALAEIDAIRPVMTYAGPLFGPLVIYGILLTNDEVELIDIEIHEDYWRLVGDDPKN